jgi:hypothetical protein
MRTRIPGPRFDLYSHGQVIVHVATGFFLFKYYNTNNFIMLLVCVRVRANRGALGGYIIELNIMHVRLTAPCTKPDGYCS